MSRLSTAKIVDLKDSFKFNISIPKEGKLIIKEIEEHDSTKEAWEFYKRKYGKYLDLEDKEIKFGNEISFKVHGETDFNFALDKVDEFIYIRCWGQKLLYSTLKSSYILLKIQA